MADVKDEFIQALRDLLHSRVPVEGLNGRTIYEKAERSAGSFSKHYSGPTAMQDLISDAATLGFSELNALLIKAVRRARELASEELLVSLARDYVEFAVGNKGLFDLMFRPDLISPLDPEEHAHAHEDLWVERARAAGALRDLFRMAFPELSSSVTVEEFSDLKNLGWSMMHGLAVFAANDTLRDLDGGDELARERRIRLAMSTLVREVRRRVEATR